jgi:hypothetical protein
VIKSCLSRVGCLALIVLVLTTGWVFRKDISGWWNRLEISASSEPSEKLARDAGRKLQELADGRSGGRLVLSQAELQSLLTFRIMPLVAEGIDDPVVEVRDSSVILSAQLHPEQLEGLASKEILRQFLSDSTRVTTELVTEVFTPGVAAVRVAGLQAGSIAVPSLMVPWILGTLEIPGVESTGSILLVPIPPQVTRIEVTPGELILTRGEGN